MPISIGCEYFCRRCRQLDYDLIPPGNLDLKLSTRYAWLRNSSCGHCRLLVAAMAEFRQEYAYYLTAGDTLRVAVSPSSPTDAVRSWLEFYYLQDSSSIPLAVNTLIPRSIQPGWHVAEFGTAECHETLSRWTAPSLRPRRLPKRVLDLSGKGDLRLAKTGGAHGVYVALSHCWVGRPVLRTTKTLLKPHLKRISTQSLSRTFQEVIAVCRSLGIRWLWIDSICIVQDDPDDWDEQAAAMAGIYANASFTIAAHGQEDKLLPAPSNWRRTLAIEEDGQSAEIHVRRVPTAPFHNGPITAPLKPGESLKESPGNWNYVALRGWCVQERVLSNAVLHFTEQEALYEQNGRISHCQCGFHTYYMFRSPWEELNANKRERWKIPQPYSCGFLSAVDISAGHWRWVVEHYTQRVLTRGDDVLPALAGIAQRFADKLGRARWQYAAGLWEELQQDRTPAPRGYLEA